MAYLCKKEFGQADKDMSAEIDIEEARTYCMTAMVQRYPEKDFDDAKFNQGFHKIDRD